MSNNNLKLNDTPIKFDHPLRLQEIPTKDQIRVIDNYSPNYDYIVEEDKIYYSRKGKNVWYDISDNDKARVNLYNFLGEKYDFRGYTDTEKKIWDLIKLGTFNYLQYRDNLNKPAVTKQSETKQKNVNPPALNRSTLERLVTARIGTTSGGYTNILLPEYMTTPNKMGTYDVKPEYLPQVYDIARHEQSYKYADPINNASNWLPFAILTGGRGLENMGYRFISPLTNKIIKGVSNVGSKAITSAGNFVSKVGKAAADIGLTTARLAGNYLVKVPQAVSEFAYSTPTRRVLTNSAIGIPVVSSTVSNIAPYLKFDKPNSDYKVVWNMAMDGDLKDAWYIGYGGLLRQWMKKFGSGESDMPSSLVIPKGSNDDNTSMYAIRPTSFVGDTVFITGSRQYILPEVLDVNEFTFSHRNRGQNTPIKSEAAPITAFTPFVPYGQQSTKSKTFIGYNAQTGKLKAGDISQFGPGDFLSGTFSNNFTKFKRDSSGNIIYKRDGAHGNGSRSVPIMTTPDGKDGSLNILTDRLLRGGTYGLVSGGRVLVRVGDELRLLSGSIENIESAFEEMKKRNNATYGTFYTLDNGSYNRGLRTVDGQFTREDLENYDKLNVGNSGNFLYITGKNNNLKFKSDTILTPNIRTVNSESYKKGSPLQNELKGVVLHHTAFMDDNLRGILGHLTNPNTSVSAHVVIGFDGTRKVLATPDKVTFHAGLSVHRGRQNVNDFMIGIEFQGDTNKKDLTPQLIESVVEYLEPIIRKNNIRLEDIVTHQDVRDAYNDYAEKAGKEKAAGKVDINKKNYNLILQALLRRVYYKK